MSPGLFGEREDLVKLFDYCGAEEVTVGSGGHSESGDVGEPVEGEVHLRFSLRKIGDGMRLIT